MVKNDFIKKYFTCLSKIFVCVAFAFLLVFSFGQNDFKKSFAYNDYNIVSTYNDITDLTGYTFTFNSGFGAPYGSYSINFNSNGETYNLLNFTQISSLAPSGPGSSICQLIYDELVVCSGTSAFLNSWIDDSYRVITIVGGTDTTNSDLISLFTSGNIGELSKTLNTYNISINLDNGIYGQTSATIEEDATLTLEYTVIDNGVFSGYVFDYGQNLITSDSGHGHISVNGNYEKITIIISDVTDDFEFTIHSIAGSSLVGQWYLDYDLFIASGLKSIDIDVVLSRPFVSNDTTYNRIYRNTNFNSFVYENTNDFELPIVNVFSFLNGLYLPVNTYNYLLIDIAYDENYINYVPADYMFFNFFRLATNEDRARVNQFNEQLVIQKENTNFVALFGAILDAQFGTLKSLLNFYIFDINVWSIVTFFLTMALIYIVVKLCKGGMSDDKKK